MSDRDKLINAIADALTKPGKGNAERVRSITHMMEKGGLLPDPESDPFHAIRNQAIEIVDLDGQPTYVTVGAILERVEAGWLPALTSLNADEARSLDHVLRIWEHEARRRLRVLVEVNEDPKRAAAVVRIEAQLLGNDRPWLTLGHMEQAQNAYRARLKLPAHPHGECCTHYQEEAHAAMAATARHVDSHGK